MKHELTFEALPLAVSQLHEKMANIERLLISQSKESEKTETEQFLTIQQAAKFLCLSVPTIYGLVHRAEIPVCKRGKRLYFSNIELSEWLKSGRKKTQPEIKANADSSLFNHFKTKNYGK